MNEEHGKKNFRYMTVSNIYGHMLRSKEYEILFLL